MSTLQERKIIPISEPNIGEEEVNNVMEAVKSGWISSKGPFIHEFEEKFAKFIGTNYGVSTSNGTTALHLALTALGIGKGDNVIVPDFTFISPINAVLYNGGTPRLIDADRSSWNIDPSKIEEKIDNKTKAIIVVHVYGHPANMDPIMKIADEHDIFVIEDCAEAHGALYKERKVGTFGDISCFSFYANKIITTGEGGICLTNQQQVAEKMEMLRDHGMKPENRYWHEEVGYNYRMTNLQAAIGVAQINKIDKLVEKRRELASCYNKYLKDISKITVPPEEPWAKSVFWLYSILINDVENNVNRDYVSKRLLQEGFDNRRFFYPVHIMPPYREYAETGDFPVSDMLSRMGMNLPSSMNVDEEIIRAISEMLRDILGEKRHCQLPVDKYR